MREELWSWRIAEGGEENTALENWSPQKVGTAAPLTCRPSPHSVAEDPDRHPERRMKAAFSAFEEGNLPRLKQENPNMRLSQLKQLLKKEWMRSPENPMNQRHAAYNSQK